MPGGRRDDWEGIEIDYLLLFLYYATLLYIVNTTRLGAVIKALVIQGGIIGLFAFGHETSPGQGGLILIILEAFLLKAAVLPYMMHRTVKKHGIKREMEPWRTNFQIVLATLCIIAGSLITARLLKNAAPLLSFPILGAALASTIVGLLVILTRKMLITHVLGYLVMENGIFLFSLAMRSQMPILIHLGVLLDIFVCVLMMNLMLHRIVSTFDDLDVRNLRELKDE